jgi:KamA family protein
MTVQAISTELPDVPGDRFKLLHLEQLDQIEQLRRLPASEVEGIRAAAHVLPFAVNTYVIEQLIDWSLVPEDPIFQLTFPQRDMLAPEDFERISSVVSAHAPREVIQQVAREIQLAMNPHPAGQATLNVPIIDREPLSGVQHKYRETVLFFPSRGQTCLSYCTYCFRWPQFVGLDDMKFAARETDGLVEYLRAHRDVSNVLFTGGDPLVMRTSLLRRYVEPLLAEDLDQVSTIRIGTKSLAFWPQRFLTDPDADDLLRLFEQIVESGRHLAFMAHFSHPRELETDVAQRALARVIATGAVVRTQAPLIRHVNDDAEVWARMWSEQVRLGAVPYYMFVERDTGPRAYFEVPLARGWQIFRDAYSSVSGLSRTVRGPSMSATPGKVVVDGVATIAGEEVFALRFLQARRPEWVGRPFFARYDPKATWLDQLRPAMGEDEFFFSEGLREIEAAHARDLAGRKAETVRARSAALAGGERSPEPIAMVTGTRR